MPDWDPIEVEPTSRTFTTPDGRVFQDSKLTISEKQATMLMHGYLCARCLEDVTALGAFPERCPRCGFEMARYQAEGLERQGMKTDLTVVSGFPLERERAHLEKATYRPKGLVTMSIPKAKRRR